MDAIALGVFVCSVLIYFFVSMVEIVYTHSRIKYYRRLREEEIKRRERLWGF